MNNLIPKKLVAIDLFAGSGGLGEGLESAGIKVVLASELHPQASLTYAFNQPDTSVLVGDVKQLTNDFLINELKKIDVSEVDIVVGGPPCQGFSTAGKKKVDDPRNTLFKEFFRVVELIRPRMFLIENVPGFKKMYEGRAYLEALSMFEGLGYECKDTVLNASHFGVPQRRKRFMMVGRLPSKTQPFEWPEQTHEVNELQNTIYLNSPTVGDALSDLSFLLPGWESHSYELKASSQYQRDRRSGSTLLFNHLATKHREKTVEMFSYIAEGSTINSVPAHIKSGKKTMARLNRHYISNTVLALPDDLIHYDHHRIPTVREMARLQSYDDDYVFFGKRTSGFMERKTDVPQYTQVGNSVPPLLARAVGKQLVVALGGVSKDVRNLHQRRTLHKYIKGSSGYAGYSLHPDITKYISLLTVNGNQLELPVDSDGSVAVTESELKEWGNTKNPMRGQWVPAI